jgi:hypothetical protein
MRLTSSDVMLCARVGEEAGKQKNSPDLEILKIFPTGHGCVRSIICALSSAGLLWGIVQCQQIGPGTNTRVLKSNLEFHEYRNKVGLVGSRSLCLIDGMTDGMSERRGGVQKVFQGVIATLPKEGIDYADPVSYPSVQTNWLHLDSCETIIIKVQVYHHGLPNE